MRRKRRSMSYFKCEQDRALTGSQSLTDEQFSVYWRSIFKSYSIGGPLPYDEDWLKPVLHKRKQDIRRIVGQLVDLGKMTLQHGFIHVSRVDEELAEWARRNDAPSLGSLPEDMEPQNAAIEVKNANGISHAHAATSDRGESLELRRETAAEKQTQASDAAAVSPRRSVPVGSPRSGVPNGDVEPPAGPAHVERLVPAERVTGLFAALSFKPMPKEDD